MTTVTEDLKALTDKELFSRLEEAIRSIPGITGADDDDWERAWDEVRRYHDELARRYRPGGAPTSAD